MKTIRQLIRQPLKTLTGIVLIALAVAILCVCVGQTLAAAKTAVVLDNSFTTVALPTLISQVTTTFYGETRSQSYLPQMPEEVVTWIEQTAQAHPELVKSISSPGLASAYIADLAPDNVAGVGHFNTYGGFSELNPDPDGAPYTCAMLEITLTQIGEPTYLIPSREDGGVLSTFMEESTFADAGVAIRLEGTVESVIGLEESYSDPTGFTVQMNLTLPSMEDLDALELAVGGRYLVFGMDYYDQDWQFRCEIANDSLMKYVHIDAFNPDYLHDYSEESIREQLQHSSKYYSAKYWDFENDIYYYFINGNEQDIFRVVTLTLSDPAAMPSYDWVQEPDGTWKPVPITERSYIDESGEEVTVSPEEYRSRYRIPTIARLDGTAEAFLSSEEGALWRQALDCMTISNHAFPVIGVDKLAYIGEFAQETASILEGRDFTDAELESGAKVCLISETLARANGLTVGDTIMPRFYDYDWSSPYQHYLSEGIGVVDPAAYAYSPYTPFVGEAEPYTIIGIYRPAGVWGSEGENLYSFSVNTIFAPKTSIPSTMDYGNEGVFRTLVLQNGMTRELEILCIEAGYDGLFSYYDHGYYLAAESLRNYQAVANQAVKVGIVAYSMVLLLFLLLFPGRQGAALAMMDSLGANRWQKIRHMMGSALGILVPGTAVGLALGLLLWKKVVDTLMESADVTVSLEMDPVGLAFVAAAQLVLAAVLTFLNSLPLTGQRSLMKRK